MLIRIEMGISTDQTSHSISVKGYTYNMNRTLTVALVYRDFQDHGRV